MTASVIGAALAILVFVVTQSFLKLVLEPIQEQRKLIGEVTYALRFYANEYEVRTIPPPDEERKKALDEVKKTLRELSARLLASLWQIPFYDLLARAKRVPKKDNVLQAADQLVAWSENLYGLKSEERRKQRRIIADRLRISEKIGEID